jgi:hypothetical protein
MRTSIVIALALFGCKHDGQELHIGKCSNRAKPIGETRWSEVSLDLIDHTEIQACAEDYSLDLDYKDQDRDKQIKRVVDVLLGKGYKEISIDQAVSKVSVSPTPSKDEFVESSPGRVFARGTDPDEVSLVVQSFPHNKGAPFLVSITRFTSKK